ncbi:RAC-beta serine/threonine-protein kinase-like isoform X2 [Oscarella lobularis]|uniref:RAC-beta serine/threonine-protein kinase-like isoform X2 n=1 Tax=Oscarella lobularis TaxID=121494 RepID=UPI003313407C
MGTCLSSVPRKASGLHKGKASRTLRPFSSKGQRLNSLWKGRNLQRKVESCDDASTPRQDSPSSQLADYDSESTRSHFETTDSSSDDAFLGTPETTRCEYERTTTFITVSREDDTDGDSRRRSGAAESAAEFDGAATPREVDRISPSKCRPVSTGICRPQTFCLGQRPSTAIAELTPVGEHVVVIDSGFADDAESLRSASIRSFHVRQPSITEYSYSSSFVGEVSSDKHRRLSDYRLLMILGAGTFGQVILVADEADRRHLSVIKAVSKSVVMERGEASIEIEKKALLAVSGNPFFVQLHETFQNEVYLFYNMEFVPGGDLLGVLLRQAPLIESDVRFYVAEVLVALQFLHGKNIIYRDLKPRNVLIDRRGHIKLCDMGIAREFQNVEDGRPSSFAGTVPYIAPEVLQEIPYNEAIDFWSLGILTYELLMGYHPFDRCDELETMNAILVRNIRPFPADFIRKECEDFICQLLIYNATNRLGVVEHVKPIRQHKFFAEINWKQAEARTLEPPFLPELGCEDGRYFPNQFTELSPVRFRDNTPIDWTLGGFTLTVDKVTSCCSRREAELTERIISSKVRRRNDTERMSSRSSAPRKKIKRWLNAVVNSIQRCWRETLLTYCSQTLNHAPPCSFFKRTNN